MTSINLNVEGVDAVDWHAIQTAWRKTGRE
jgi:hypothetical protein